MPVVHVPVLCRDRFPGILTIKSTSLHSTCHHFSDPDHDALSFSAVFNNVYDAATSMDPDEGIFSMIVPAHVVNVIIPVTFFAMDPFGFPRRCWSTFTRAICDHPRPQRVGGADAQCTRARPSSDGSINSLRNRSGSPASRCSRRHETLLLELNARFLYHAPPFQHLALKERSELLRRAADWHRAVGFEARRDVR